MGFLTAHKGGWLPWTVPRGSATFTTINTFFTSASTLKEIYFSKGILTKWRRFEGNKILIEIWRIFLKIWRKFEGNLNNCPPENNSLSNVEEYWSRTFRRVMIYWLNLCMGVNTADAEQKISYNVCRLWHDCLRKTAKITRATFM